MHILYMGLILGAIIYASWISYYFLYLPNRVKSWFESSLARLFILDIALTVVSMTALSNLSDSLTAVVASSVVGLLATITTIYIQICQRIKSMFRVAASKQ